MSGTALHIKIAEWETASPSTCKSLRGVTIDSTPQAQKDIAALNQSGMLRLTELKDGLQIVATSYVGRVQLGNLQITVLPKLKTSSLVRLLRYALGLQKLSTFAELRHFSDDLGFEDLLIHQLNQEAEQLIHRGLQRVYVRQEASLAVPRGRIDIDRLALQGGLATASLPCQYFPRLEDTVLNRLLLSGLRFAGAAASTLTLRREARRLAALIEEQVAQIELSETILAEAERQLTRITNQYAPAVTIIRTLFQSQGVVLEGQTAATQLPGFLFDMNAFFQALMSRFLKDNLDEIDVRDEKRLQGMMRYHPQYNPQQKRSPTPRPDYAIMRKQELVSLVDAKYRDLWDRSLPQHMLYQLVVYAMSQRRLLQSSILYPTTSPQAREARIDVTDPINGNRLGQVCLRPVHLDLIDELITSDAPAMREKRKQEAHFFAFGNHQS